MKSTTDMPKQPGADDLAPDDDAELIVLAPYIRQARRLIKWYETLADKDSPIPDIEELDTIVVELQELPTLQGQLGEDLDLIAGGGGGDKAEVINAINRLRRLAALDFSTPDESE